MNKQFIIAITFSSLTLVTKAQSSIEDVLLKIEQNNKYLKASNQMHQAQNYQYKTGLAPANPSINFDYLIGSPSQAGNQIDFSANQSFDFPSVYKKKRQLSDQQILLSEFDMNGRKIEVLNEARKLCIHWVYANKQVKILEARKENIQRLSQGFQSQLDKGEGTILDVNKAKLQLVEVNNIMVQNATTIDELKQRLAELNGGVEIILKDTIYPSMTDPISFEDIEAKTESNDPLLKYLIQEKVISENMLAVAKDMNLPKLEAGYHYQGILGQRFNGLHIGFTLPLWENKNKVEAARSHILYNEMKTDAHKNEHLFEVKKLFNRYNLLKNSLIDYENFFKNDNNGYLIRKSLELGQITTIEYFLELSYYNTAMDNYLSLEKEYHLALAELLKFAL